MRQTILLADDSPTIQRLVTQTFADTRFDIISVSNGDAAIRKFDEIQPSVVLADIYMPGKNGYEVCAFVKAHAALSSTPVVLLVGAFDAFDENTSSHMGASAYIKKPFEPRALVELVKSVLEGREESAAEPKVSKPAPRATPDTTKQMPAAPASPATVQIPEASAVDLLGLEKLFEPELTATKANAPLSDEEIDKIADRVTQKLSMQVIESIAWDVVPDIVTRILREELKRTTHEG